MRGTISFHPVDPSFFETTVEPLVHGEKINPEEFLAAALRNVVAWWEAARYKETLAFLREQIEPPPPPEEGTMWERVRSRLERFDHKPSPLVRTVAATVEPDLHLKGRPFLVTEGSADAVAATVERFAALDTESSVERLIVEQLAKLDESIPETIELDDWAGPPPPGAYRAQLLEDLKVIYDQGRAARAGDAWGSAGSRREPAREVLVRELPWRAMQLHSRAVPFWIGEDVDGLETVCRAAGVEPPLELVPAWMLLARSCETFPELREHLTLEIDDERGVGGYVPPADVPALIDFLNDHGARIIQTAARHGVGPTCTTLLRKIRECASYAQRCGFGYLEVGGVLPPGPEKDSRD